MCIHLHSIQANTCVAIISYRLNNRIQNTSTCIWMVHCMCIWRAHTSTTATLALVARVFFLSSLSLVSMYNVLCYTVYIYIYAVRCSINNIVHNIKSSRPKLTFRLFHIIGFTLWVCVCARLCACECITFGLFHRQTTKFRLIHFYTTATNTVILFVPSCNAVTDCCSRISTKIHYSEQYYFFFVF